MAIIHLPIEVHENGSIVPLTDYIKVDIDKCNELPDPTSIKMSLTEQINAAIQEKKQDHMGSDVEQGTVSEQKCSDRVVSESDSESEQPPQKLTISREELEKISQRSRQPIKNSSFKNHFRSSSRHTMKKRSNSIIA